jgi:hypothetical protein
VFSSNRRLVAWLIFFFCLLPYCFCTESWYARLRQRAVAPLGKVLLTAAASFLIALPLVFSFWASGALLSRFSEAAVLGTVIVACLSAYIEPWLPRIFPRACFSATIISWVIASGFLLY